MSDAQDMIDAVVAAGRDDAERNLILESEHLPISVDLAGRTPQYDVRVIVATRYCVLPLEETGDLSSQREAQLRGWLTRREHLFRMWTLPSMKAQQHQPTWLLLVDTRLMHIVGPAIAADLPDWAYIVPVPAGRSSSSILDEVVQVDRWAVAARVDNDDSVAVDYCKALAIWAGLANPGQALLSFPFGTQVVGDQMPRFAPSVTGHFSALVIPPGGRLNASLAYMHPEVYRGGIDVPVRQLLTTQPMWCEVVHGQNLANHARPGVRLGEDASYWNHRFGWMA